MWDRLRKKVFPARWLLLMRPIIPSLSSMVRVMTGKGLCDPGHEWGKHFLVVNKTDRGTTGTLPENALLMSLADDYGVDGFLDQLAARIVQE